MNDDELRELMHNVHTLQKTNSQSYFTPQDFYNIVTKNIIA